MNRVPAIPARSHLILVVTCIVAAVVIDRYYFDIYNLAGSTCKIDDQDRIARWKRLEKNFSVEIFGQHVATDGVLNALYSHIKNPRPRKALVLALHGNVGSGKTHMSQLIAEHLFDGGFSSPFVHAFIGPRHFVNDVAGLRENQERLQKRIEEAGKLCGRSLFVFDEVDKMPPEILNVIIPYIDHHSQVDGVDYRGLIFIFLSNTGSKAIRDFVYKELEMGKSRESITIYDFRQLLAKDAFAEKGGLFQADMIGKRLVDHYIPFLPLQMEHVVQCAKRDIAKRRVLFVQPEDIAAKVVYVPKNNPVFAEDGCKTVGPFLDFFIHKAETVLD